MWNMSALTAPVQTYPAPGFEEPGLQALFFDGEPYEGRDTRVFAWLGLPENISAAKVPAMVLVHGGGGTAFGAWVRLWNKRGYAAIAMDTCGCVPAGEYGAWQRHEHAGPFGQRDFASVDKRPEEQWTYHAIAAVIRAHTLLSRNQAVDAERIGLTGISWGGYLTCIAAGVDGRFKFAAPVYGCGNLGGNSAWLEEFAKLGSPRRERWLGLWDPAVYLPNAAMPMLWVAGTNDFAYPMDSLQQSYRLPKTARQLCIRVRMEHGHGGHGENPKEIHSFANHLLQENEPPLTTITRQSGDQKEASIDFTPHRPIVSATLNYTKHCWCWVERQLSADNARIDLPGGRITMDIPADVQAYYVNLIDQDQQVVSSEHITLHSAAALVGDGANSAAASG